jgi:hypothetical protein
MWCLKALDPRKVAAGSKHIARATFIALKPSKVKAFLKSLTMSLVNAPANIILSATAFCKLCVDQLRHRISR